MGPKWRSLIIMTLIILLYYLSLLLEHGCHHIQLLLMISISSICLDFIKGSILISHVYLVEKSEATHIYIILEWSLVYTNSLQPFQSLGHWHAPKDIYNPAGQIPCHYTQPPPLISLNNYTVVPHTFNQSAPWYAYIPCSQSGPHLFSKEVCDKVGDDLILLSGYVRLCRKFLERSQRVYQGWQQITGDWLKGFVYPRKPVEPYWVHGQSMPDTFASISNISQSLTSLINSLLVYAYECSGYAAFLMYTCINQLMRLCNVPCVERLEIILSLL